MSRIRTFSFDRDELAITWEDASESILQATWLRDHCQMPASRNPDNGQRLVSLTDLPEEIAIDRVELETSRLVIDFSPDGHRSEFDLDWLYSNCYCLNRPTDDRSAAGKILWSGDSFAQQIPRVAWPDFESRPARKRAALQAVRDYGFVVIDSVPCEEGQVLRVIEQFGYLRETNYGKLFDVRTRVDPNNLAYTNLGLGCHLDNPYRDPVPGVQLLHCLESSAEGGESILQDGFMAAQKLREEDPEHFALLSQHWISFRFEDTDTDLRARGPMIEVNDLDEVIRLRFNNRSIDTLLLPPQILRLYYPAYRHFAEILEREDLQIRFRLEPGELILFDNTRILHARTPYSAAGTRHLQGAYSDLDGLYSCLRKLEAQA